MFKEHEQVVLTVGVVGDEGQDLRPGDVGTVVHLHPGGDAFVVEFMSLSGDAVAIATVLSWQARSVKGSDLTHARTIPAATGL